MGKVEIAFVSLTAALTMRNLILYVLLFSSILFNFMYTAVGPVVQTKLGMIIGKRVYIDRQNAYVNAFLGVPYAEPPLGPLRFKHPEKKKPWLDPISATSLPAACFQYATGPHPFADFLPGQSEDCLYLNIWAPYPLHKGQKRAVMFWIYGGSFDMGSNRLPVYDGRALATMGDVVVVVINYRLGALGFLYSNSADAPGNVGLYDILLALKWVNENIDSFGGDRSRITIMGESAGSLAVGLLSVSPLAKGLYKRAIMESCSPVFLLHDNGTHTLDISQIVAKEMDCADDTVTITNSSEKVVGCLREVDAYELTKAGGLLPPDPADPTITFLNRYGDSILPDNPLEAINSGNFHNTDLLTGGNHDEGSNFMTTSYYDIFGFFGEKDPKINKTFGEKLMRTIFRDFPDKDSAVNYYLDNLGEYDYDDIRSQVYTALGDNLVLCPTVYFAEKSAEKGSNVYFYFFHHRPSPSDWSPWMGSCHFDEVQFVFGQPLINRSNYTWPEITLSARMIRMWTNFAKYGNPSNEWPLYSRQSPFLMLLQANKGSTIGKGPHQANCNFFRPYVGMS